MLDYQVEYWKSQEQRRTNLANEKLKAEANKIAQQQADSAAKQAEVAAANAATNRYNAETQRLAAQYNYEIGQYQSKAALTQASAAWTNALTNQDKQSTYQQSVDSQSSVNAQTIATGRAQQKFISANTKLVRAQTKGQSISNQWANANNAVNVVKDATTAIRNIGHTVNLSVDTMLKPANALSGLMKSGKKN